jgi:dual specificity phosphatase 12
VHCVRGASRSATIVAAYLIYKKGASVNDTLELLKSKRKQAKPREGFVNQLEMYEKELRKM